MATQRKVRSDKKTRVNPPLDEDTHALLCRLALACNGMAKTALAEEIIGIAVRDPEFVQMIQTRHNAGRFRVIPINLGGRVTYMDSN